MAYHFTCLGTRATAYMLHNLQAQQHWVARMLPAYRRARNARARCKPSGRVNGMLAYLPYPYKQPYALAAWL